MGLFVKLAARAAAKVLAEKAANSVTSRVGGTVVIGGALATVVPQVLEYIPEHFRGPAMIVIGTGVVLARHRQEIMAMYAQLKAEYDAIEAAAKK